MTDVRAIYVLHNQFLSSHPFTWLYKHPVSVILCYLFMYATVDRVQEQSNSKTKSINLIITYESLQMAWSFRTMGGLFRGGRTKLRSEVRCNHTGPYERKTLMC